MILEAALIGSALVSGIDLRLAAVLSMAVVAPYPTAALLIVHLVRSRSSLDASEAIFCQSVARELRSGADLRRALLSSSRPGGPIEEHLSGGGRVSQIDRALDSELPTVAPELSVIVAAVATSGAASAELFDEIAQLALAQIEIAEDVRVASAPARASTLVMVGLPVAYLGYQLATGGIGALVRSPAQQMLAMVGWGLILTGIVASLVLVRRAG